MKQDLLVVVDYFSKFLIMRKLPNSMSQATWQELSLIFSEYGKPHLNRLDHSSCYASEESIQLQFLFFTPGNIDS